MMILRDANATNEGYEIFAELTGRGREGEPRIIDEAKASGVAGARFKKGSPNLRHREIQF